MKSILAEFNLKPIAFDIIDESNKDDFIDIEPYQLSCLYGGDKLAINFIYTLEILNSEESLDLRILLSKAGLFSYKLKYMRIIHNLLLLKNIRKNKVRLKILQYLKNIDPNFSRIKLF